MKEEAMRVEATQVVQSFQLRNKELESNATQTIQQLEHQHASQLLHAEQTNQQLMATIDQQARQLREQSSRQEEMMQMIASLQSQIVIAKHAPQVHMPKAPEPNSENGADTGVGIDVNALMQRH